MATHIHQSAKGRAGARVKITSDYSDKKITLRIPHGIKIKVRKA